MNNALCVVNGERERESEIEMGKRDRGRKMRKAGEREGGREGGLGGQGGLDMKGHIH